MTKKTLFLAAPLALAATADDEPVLFEGVAYSGGLVPDFGMVVDLSSVNLETPMPLLLNHNASKDIGAVTEAAVGDNVTISGTLFAGIDDDADKVIAKSRAGAAYQMSVGLYDFNVEFVATGKTATVNGQEFNGPVDVIRDAYIRETSIVPLGADPSTSVQVFSWRGNEYDNPNNNHPTESHMADEDTGADALKAENETLKAQLAAMQEQIDGAALAARTDDVKALFKATGQEYSDDAAKPYIDMPSEAFSAVSKQMSAMAKSLGGKQPPQHDYQPDDKGGDSVLLSVAKQRYSAI